MKHISIKDIVILEMVAFFIGSTIVAMKSATYYFSRYHSLLSMFLLYVFLMGVWLVSVYVVSSELVWDRVEHKESGMIMVSLWFTIALSTQIFLMYPLAVGF